MILGSHSFLFLNKIPYYAIPVQNVPMLTKALMMEVVITSEKSVNLYQTTQRNIPENSHLHTRRQEKVKSHHSSYDKIKGA
jgi:ATP/ADP translocase